MSAMPRKMSLFAAGVAAALWIATPATAAEIAPPALQAAPATQAAPAAKVKTASIKRHYVWPRYRIASWYTSHLRYADVAPAAWQHYYSARPVLLMVGIAY